MTYEKPQITELGTLSQLTLGTGGTSIDGNNCTQRGGGNDGTGPKDSCED